MLTAALRQRLKNLFLRRPALAFRLFRMVQPALGLESVRVPIELRVDALVGDGPRDSPDEEPAKAVRLPLSFPAQDAVILPRMMREGVWEPRVVRALLRALPADRPAGLVDVGANVGMTALHLGLSLRGLGREMERILALEPSAPIARCLRDNLSAAGLQQAVVLECALGPTADEAVLYLDPLNGGNNSLFADAVGAQSAIERVPVRPLDQALGEAGYGAAETLFSQDAAVILKLDVQGFEPQALAGISEALLARVHVVLVEVTPALLHHAREEDRAAMIRRLSAFRRAAVIDEHAHTPEAQSLRPVEPGDLEGLIRPGSQEHFNLILTR